MTLTADDGNDGIFTRAPFGIDFQQTVGLTAIIDLPVKYLYEGRLYSSRGQAAIDLEVFEILITTPADRNLSVLIESELQLAGELVITEGVNHDSGGTILSMVQNNRVILNPINSLVYTGAIWTGGTEFQRYTIAVQEKTNKPDIGARTADTYLFKPDTSYVITIDSQIASNEYWYFLQLLESHALTPEEIVNKSRIL